MFVGGNLFDTGEKFAQLYGERVKHARKYFYQDLALKGVSFLNLEYILYEKNWGYWYSPELVAQLEVSDIDDILEYELDLGDIFDDYDGERFII
jgi:hypothetical protein